MKDILSKWWTSQIIKKLKKLSVFITLTYEDKKRWPELKNINVINNPLPFSVSQSSDCNSKEVIAVGRYTYQKGFDMLIEAWRNVSKKHPDWILKIYGDGDRNEYLNLTNKFDIRHSCLLKPAVPNILNKYFESSIFVLSSRFEGFGMVLIEAMACGVPPISFNCPSGPNEIIKDGIDGLLVKNGCIDDLTTKICYLIENEEIRIEMGKQAKINVERFKIENIALQWDALFNSLLRTVADEEPTT